MVITGLTRNQVIPNGTEGSNPSHSAKDNRNLRIAVVFFM